MPAPRVSVTLLSGDSASSPVTTNSSTDPVRALLGPTYSTLTTLGGRGSTTTLLRSLGTIATLPARSVMFTVMFRSPWASLAVTTYEN